MSESSLFCMGFMNSNDPNLEILICMKGDHLLYVLVVVICRPDYDYDCRMLMIIANCVH
jgi:hypothetical protein